MSELLSKLRWFYYRILERMDVVDGEYFKPTNMNCPKCWKDLHKNVPLHGTFGERVGNSVRVEGICPVHEEVETFDTKILLYNGKKKEVRVIG